MFAVPRVCADCGKVITDPVYMYCLECLSKAEAQGIYRCIACGVIVRDGQFFCKECELIYVWND